VIVASKMGQFPPNQMSLGQEMSKYQAIDMLNLENGIEEEDLIIAFNKYDLSEAAEFREIMQKAQVSVQSKVQEAMKAVKERQSQIRQMQRTVPPRAVPS